ncbi:ABC transporter permease [Kordiimonas pumila]|uniref:ABC transporter permease n=1 Tax=Kordiimonas pumila TaxID=2161677 RepID=A0ABV7D7F8_9PROT|nr:ABC transporter permease [Kordiimonas pumila]
MMYALKRLIASLPTLLILSVFVFALIRMVPGDPAAVLVGDIENSAELERVREEMGLNKPLPVQYLIWLENVAAGNLGTSFMTDQPVTDAIIKHFAITAQIVSIAFLIAGCISIPAGVYAARYQNTQVDTIITGAATFFLSVPSFWVGMILILIFAATLGWMPALGFVPFTNNPLEWARHISLPVLALVFVETAILTRLMRASTLEVLSQDYISYARAKGLPEKTIIIRHALKNALSPTITMLGLIFGSLLSGTAVIETIFGLPGLGRLLVDAIYARDYPVIQGTLLFIVLIYMAVNLIVDLIYPLLDPRVKMQ